MAAAVWPQNLREIPLLYVFLGIKRRVGKRAVMPGFIAARLIEALSFHILIIFRWAPGSAKLYILKERRQPGDLLKPEDFMELS